ncbi:uncharacterized protein [Battus philenor]|uniref:uncharacterized protein n=1 Tax=Battus philenor TaxID=42288 RepID=UPI0035CF18E6
MYKLLIIFLLSFVHGYQDKLQNDADLQSVLMPQELNPTFVSNKAQHPEINDQFDTIHITTTPKVTDVPEDETPVNITLRSGTNDIKPMSYILCNFYKILRMQIKRIILAPKIKSVLKNIGTCMVNGAMELIAYYFPAPIIPLITSAAGMVIPFEPVVMLKHRMPVSSYRRAIIMAVNTFMKTFNDFKMDYDDDPYMTRRFNRRFIKDSKEKRVI